LPFYKDKAFEKQQNLLANAPTNRRLGMAFCFLSKQNLLVFSLFVFFQKVKTALHRSARY